MRNKYKKAQHIHPHTHLIREGNLIATTPCERNNGNLISFCKDQPTGREITKWCYYSDLPSSLCRLCNFLNKVLVGGKIASPDGWRGECLQKYNRYNTSWTRIIYHHPKCPREQTIYPAEEFNNVIIVKLGTTAWGSMLSGLFNSNSVRNITMLKSGPSCSKTAVNYGQEAPTAKWSNSIKAVPPTPVTTEWMLQL